MFKKRSILAIVLLVTMVMGTLAVQGATSVKGGLTDNYNSYAASDMVTFLTNDQIWTNYDLLTTSAIAFDTETVGSGTNQFITLSASTAADAVLSGENLLGSKPGLFTADQTIFKFRIKSDTADSSNPANVFLTHKDQYSRNDSKNIVLLRFDYNGVFLFGSGSHKITFTPNAWYDCSAVLDKVNQCITLNVNGTVASLDLSSILIDQNLIIRLQSKGGNHVSIDDVTIADAFYHEEDVTLVDENFEELEETDALASDSALAEFYTLPGGQVAIVKDAANNKFARISGGEGANATPLFMLNDAVPAGASVLEFDLRLDPDSEAFESFIRYSSGVSVSLVKYGNGTLQVCGKTVELTDIPVTGEDFVHFKFAISAGAESTVSGYVGDQWISTYTTSDYNLTDKTIRFQIGRGGTVTDPTLTVVDLDNIRYAIPVLPKFRAVAPKTTGISNRHCISLEANNAINTSTLKPENFLLNGSSANIEKVELDDETGFCKVYVAGMAANQTYTLSTAPNAVKDTMDQYFNFETTFTTGTITPSVTFVSGGAPIEAIPAEAATVTTQVAFAVSGDAWAGKVLIALYENGVLKDCYIDNGNSLSESTSVSQDFATTANSEIRVFAWDYSNVLSPVTTKVVINKDGLQ